MIVGVGLDLASIEFWRQALQDRKSAVLDGTFTSLELEYARAHPEGPACRLATRFAAKEAFVKAIGSARVDQPPHSPHVDFREIEVETDDYGRPFLRLRGRAARMAGDVGARKAWVSLSHEGEMAQAVVVLEA